LAKFGSRIRGRRANIPLARTLKKPVLRQTASRTSLSTPPALLKTAAPNWLSAALAADAKQAKDIRVLDLREVTTFTDVLVVASGANSKQIQTIADEVETRLREDGERPLSVEGYDNAEWILLDYGDLVVNIFSEKSRSYYDLERLWRDGKALEW